jgi:integrase
VFGREAERPFNPSSVYRRAFAKWEAAGLEPIRLHECRHSFVTLWTDAGVALERAGDYAGHSSTGITNRYRHLRDGRRADDVALVNAFLASAAAAMLEVER